MENSFNDLETTPHRGQGIVTLGYGLILSVAMIVFILLIFLTVEDKQSPLNYLSYLILLAGILMAQINYRNKYLGGYIEYGKAFVVGMLTALFASIIVGIFTFVFFKYIDPGAMEEIMAMSEQQMMDRGMSDLEIEQGMDMAKRFNTPGMYTTFAVLSNFIIGVVISLITAIFVKRENKDLNLPTA